MAAEVAIQNDAASYKPPRTRQRIQRALPSLDVPNIDEDAAERKRVLNVLAQRRYRERKRQKRTREPSTGDSDGGGEPRGSSVAAASTTTDHVIAQQDAQLTEEQITSTEEQTVSQGSVFDAEAAAEVMFPEIPPVLDVGFPEPWPPHALESTMSGVLEELGISFSPDTAVSAIETIDGSSSESLNSINPSLLFDLSASPPGGGSTPGSGSGDFSFPDTYYLPMPQLTLLKAFIRISERLECKNLWDLSAQSPFARIENQLCSSSSSSSSNNNNGGARPCLGRSLPVTWRPTPSQSTVPHHPLLDLLPWPVTRDRLIAVMSLPDAARPPSAVGPLAVVQLAYDLEDDAEGMRIWGGDPCDAAAWEVGQKLFERWWFIFDRHIIDQSNRWRSLRGAAALTLTHGPAGDQLGAEVSE